MADKKQTQILLINDMAGYGKVALQSPMHGYRLRHLSTRVAL